MTAGVTPAQASLLTGTALLCDGAVGEGSIWVLLNREGHRLFPDEMFADLFAETGRRSVPPRIVATVMVLQKLFGLSDREAVEAFTFDARWKYACGGLDFDYPSFAHTVLVDMRARLARSERPDRIRDVTIEAAGEAGLVGAKRVLDSTPLYDAVATMDTITLMRSAMRGLLKVVAGSTWRCCARRERRRRLRQCRQTADRLGRRRGQSGADRFACQRRHGVSGRAGWPRPRSGGRRCGRLVGSGRGTRPRTKRGRRVPDCPPGGTRPDHLHRRPRRPPRSQDNPPRL